MTATAIIERREGPEAVEFLDAILPVYEEVYAEPPYHEGPREVAEFLDRFYQETEIPGFRLLIAATNAEIRGFAFGFLLPADTLWWSGLSQPLPSELTTETGRRTFATIELAIRAPYRRQGIATQLHTALLDGISAERATLTVRPEPETAPARAAYAAWGYRKVGQIQPWPEAPVYDAMLLDHITR